MTIITLNKNHQGALAVIADALLHYRETKHMPPLWGREHSEARAQAVLDALTRAGFALTGRSNGT